MHTHTHPQRHDLTSCSLVQSAERRRQLSSSSLILLKELSEMSVGLQLASAMSHPHTHHEPAQVHHTSRGLPSARSVVRILRALLIAWMSSECLLEPMFGHFCRRTKCRLFSEAPSGSTAQISHQLICISHDAVIIHQNVTVWLELNTHTYTRLVC